MPNRKNYTDTAQDVADAAVDAARRTRQAIDEATQRAKHKAKEFGQLTADKIDESRAPVAEALHGASEKLDEAAENAPAKAVGRVARTAADRLEDTAKYVEDHDTGEMIGDLLGVIKRHPVPSLLIAASLGFIVARSMQRD